MSTTIQKTDFKFFPQFHRRLAPGEFEKLSFSNKVGHLTNSYITPASIVAFTALELINLTGKNVIPASTFNFLNGLSDLVAALGDVYRPGSLIGNIPRAFSNFFISNDSLKVLANQLFSLFETFIKMAWAVEVNPTMKAERDTQKGFLGKFAVELKHFIKWPKSFVSKILDPSKRQSLANEFREGGFSKFVGNRASSLIMGSAWLGMLGSALVLIGNLFPDNKTSGPTQTTSLDDTNANQTNKDQASNQPSVKFENMNPLHKFGWVLVKIGMGLLTLSYFSKAFSPRYRREYGVLASGLSAATFALAVGNIASVHNPDQVQGLRVARDTSGRFLSWIERSVGFVGQRGLTQLTLRTNA